MKEGEGEGRLRGETNGRKKERTLTLSRHVTSCISPVCPHKMGSV